MGKFALGEDVNFWQPLLEIFLNVGDRIPIADTQKKMYMASSRPKPCTEWQLR